VAFSPDGTLLASGSEASTIKLWDVTTGVELRTLGGHAAAVTSVAFSPDGTPYGTTLELVDSSLESGPFWRGHVSG